MAVSVNRYDSNIIAFNYLLAASWHPKSRQRQQQQQQQQQDDLEDAKANAERTLRWKQKLRAAHPGRVDAGEDAFFHVSTPSRVALGVADGVGGWSEMGVDPALFSWALMNNAENIARLTDTMPLATDDDCLDAGAPANLNTTADATSSVLATAAEHVKSDGAKTDALAAGGERRILDAQSILDGAYTELVQSGTVEAGSSTACILSLCKLTGTLRASNLGDSAFMLIRDNQCIYESPSQQHFWNCPYQLTVLPPRLRQPQQQQPTGVKAAATAAATATRGAVKKPAKYVQDLPKDAVQTTHQLQDGDVIVLATDGFWDNVFAKEAIELVDQELGDVIREQQQQAYTRQQQEAEIEMKMAAATTTTTTTTSIMTKTTTTTTTTTTTDMVMTADEILARVRALSKRLTNTARRFSLDPKRMTPFSQGARHIQCGGKVDDITVIVTLVRSTRPRSS
ncbi:hypothetical protein BGZ99_004909 [Dissophora globulifera]|uniref:Protein phosphatase n=1 Tax=Dissophora globulifera TaxID=979702 RepID=A0A9P6RT40_9FUNG|nr:hypothetical protein BGZ99_004909 [Dissophora globulifera]